MVSEDDRQLAKVIYGPVGGRLEEPVQVLSRSSAPAIQTRSYRYDCGRWVPIVEQPWAEWREAYRAWRRWLGDDLAARPLNFFAQASLADVRGRR